jgi:cytosine/adenosine deaminase-related metal-dependent hydrolase
LSAAASANSAAITIEATRHGDEMLRKGFTIAPVVHDYSDICQTITEVARDSSTPIEPAEFQILNVCLDSAIGSAVTEFLRQREQSLSKSETERLAALAHEQRNLISAGATPSSSRVHALASC